MPIIPIVFPYRREPRKDVDWFWVHFLSLRYSWASGNLHAVAIRSAKVNSAVVLLTKLGIPQRGTFLSVHVFLSTNVAFMCIADTNLRGFAANITSLSNSTSPSA